MLRWLALALLIAAAVVGAAWWHMTRVPGADQARAAIAAGVRVLYTADGEFRTWIDRVVQEHHLDPASFRVVDLGPISSFQRARLFGYNEYLLLRLVSEARAVQPAP